MSLERQITTIVTEAVDKAIVAALSSYNSPLQKLVDRVVAENNERLLTITRQAFTDTIDNAEFRAAVHSAFVHKLARFLVSKVEGSVERAANLLLQDPATRARMVLQVQSVIDGSSALSKATEPKEGDAK